MADQETTVTTDTLVDVAQDKAVKKVLRDMFADIQPRLGEEKTELIEIFTPESASELLQRLMDFSSIVIVLRTRYQETLEQVSELKSTAPRRSETRFSPSSTRKIKPIEASYRQVWLFFENSEVPDGKKRKPVEFFHVQRGSCGNEKSRKRDADGDQEIHRSPETTILISGTISAIWSPRDRFLSLSVKHWKRKPINGACF